MNYLKFYLLSKADAFILNSLHFIAPVAIDESHKATEKKRFHPSFINPIIGFQGKDVFRNAIYHLKNDELLILSPFGAYRLKLTREEKSASSIGLLCQRRLTDSGQTAFSHVTVTLPSQNKSVENPWFYENGQAVFDIDQWGRARSISPSIFEPLYSTNTGFFSQTGKEVWVEVFLPELPSGISVDDQGVSMTSAGIEWRINDPHIAKFIHTGRVQWNTANEDGFFSLGKLPF